MREPCLEPIGARCGDEVDSDDPADHRVAAQLLVRRVERAVRRPPGLVARGIRVLLDDGRPMRLDVFEVVPDLAADRALVDLVGGFELALRGFSPAQSIESVPAAREGSARQRRAAFRAELGTGGVVGTAAAARRDDGER